MEKTSSDLPAAHSLYVVGLGPGDTGFLPPLALRALQQVSCIAGYPLYLDLLPPELLKGKKIIASGMRREQERCQAAIDEASSGSSAAIVCSGDPGIYALAGLVLEMLEAEKKLSQVNLSILPGIPAFSACASLLGAPLTHDFACVSLSDLLTPWETIEKRLMAALAGDFVLVLYNPRSKGRPHYLQKAISYAKIFRANNCPVGLVRNAYRKNQFVSCVPLSRFDTSEVDMLSLVIIGNTQSRMAGSFFLTPRGYHIREV
ncbi:MAG: precorrin-3B C(17)-methyltransferase [Desulfovibrio sp.]|nr:precorrin-3B C(17)-methyltransferase [Desulfovibrio sp.]